MFRKAISQIANAVKNAGNAVSAPAPAPAPMGSGSSAFRSRLAARNQANRNNVADAISMSKAGNVAGASDALRREVGMKKGGKVGSASKRADGCAQRGKTKGKMV